MRYGNFFNMEEERAEFGKEKEDEEDVGEEPELVLLLRFLVLLK